jgi:hypothetical protein
VVAGHIFGILGGDALSRDQTTAIWHEGRVVGSILVVCLPSLWIRILCCIMGLI